MYGITDTYVGECGQRSASAERRYAPPGEGARSDVDFRRLTAAPHVRRYLRESRPRADTIHHHISHAVSSAVVEQLSRVPLRQRVVGELEARCVRHRAEVVDHDRMAAED